MKDGIFYFLVVNFVILFFMLYQQLFGYGNFFDVSKVELKKGDIRSFVFYDRLDGYYENKTFSYAGGEGYKVRNTVIFRDFISVQNDKPLNRREADKIFLYPSYFEVLYQNHLERMYVIQNKQYVVIQIESQSPSRLGIIALLNWFKKDVSVRKLDERTIVVENTKVKGSAVPSFAIINSDKDVELIQDPTNILKEVKVSPTFGNSGLIVSKDSVNKVSYVVVFSTNELEGIRNASNVISDIQVFLDSYKREIANRVLGSRFETDLKDIIDKPLYWSLYSGDGFVVEEFGKGIWAGLPWFKNNWGRDTFISLAGCSLVNGNFAEAKDVILNFANFQDKGNLSIEIISDDEEFLRQVLQDIKNISKFIGLRKLSNRLLITVPGYMFSKTFSSKGELISKSKTLKENEGKYVIRESIVKSKTYGRVPNLVSSETSVQYNTADGTPWFIREIMNYVNYSGDLEFLKEIYPVVKLAIEGAIENFVDSDGLLTHDDADTWMDARIEGKEAWSPRGNRAVEVQSLWITSLEVGVFMASYVGDGESSRKWSELYKKAKENFVKVFWDDVNKKIADRVRSDGFKDFKVRPNMLMTITVPFDASIVGEDREAYILRNAVVELLYPYGIASLSQNDEFFHPWHERWDLYHKDSAYHNGTVWVWNTGFVILSLLKFGYKDLAYSLFTNTLNQVINEGHVGTLSELIDAIPQQNGRIKLSGTYSQAWSVAEINRAWYQGFIGFNPRLSQNKIIFSPNLPRDIRDIKASLKFGKEEYLDVEIKNSEYFEVYSISPRSIRRKLEIVFIYTDDYKGDRYFLSFPLTTKSEVKVDKKKKTITLNGKLVKPTILKGYKDIIGDLGFVVPSIPDRNQVSKEKDYLKKKILDREWF
ncbi:MAG: GH116 family glycosyl hydrolase [Brevinematales bacterium]|nr:GH116 family glycosyl hydrolase [Brevinematales bacterium]